MNPSHWVCYRCWHRNPPDASNEVNYVVTIKSQLMPSTGSISSNAIQRNIIDWHYVGMDLLFVGAGPEEEEGSGIIPIALDNKGQQPSTDENGKSSLVEEHPTPEGNKNMASRPLLLDPPIISNHRCSPITKDQVKEMVQGSVRESNGISQSSPKTPHVCTTSLKAGTHQIIRKIKMEYTCVNEIWDDKTGKYKVVESADTHTGDDVLRLWEQFAGPTRLCGSIDLADINPNEAEESELLICSPTVFGFCLSSKQSLEFAVPEAQKKPIWALTQTYLNRAPRDGFRDLVQGKGRAAPPGVGKTLTAETIAETFKIPLYIVPAGQIGVDPVVKVESVLKTVFKIASRWKAILLLDEADVSHNQPSAGIRRSDDQQDTSCAEVRSIGARRSQGCLGFFLGSGRNENERSGLRQGCDQRRSMAEYERTVVGKSHLNDSIAAREQFHRVLSLLLEHKSVACRRRRSQRGGVSERRKQEKKLEDLAYLSIPVFSVFLGDIVGL
ncbi:P-loop containing nucleoside triphosphate hydrolase protein [Zalerion maritima]|uniref:P-loop containing nucleoside triphosphate hydrolase protein n=1 Tax=Zalerion maritima TaxID=339359 RepID=A0AAD5WTW1_9PEZI|nr:P-loop containing nucleoside triphosphate hydrolase protein [Zalerion maritima]